MLDENRTEASREGDLNAYESFFGDTVAAPPAELGKEQEVSIEPDQNQQGSDLDKEEQAVVAEIAPDDLKVVVSIREGRASIGVQQPSSDPYIEPVGASELSGLAGEVVAVVERARTKWEDEPKYPAHERPAPPARRRPRRGQGSAEDSTTEEGADQQRPEALRLF